MMRGLISGAAAWVKPVVTLDDITVDSWLFQLTTRDILQDADSGSVSVLDIDASTDTNVQEDDKGSSQSRDEEVGLGTMGLLPGHVRAEATNTVEHDQRAETKGGVDLGVGKALEGIDDDLVGGVAGVDTLDAHELGHLTGNNGDARTGHEGADGGQRDELDQPSNSSESQECDDGTNNKSQS